MDANMHFYCNEEENNLTTDQRILNSDLTGDFTILEIRIGGNVLSFFSITREQLKSIISASGKLIKKIDKNKGV